jgi:hypothetical protein
MNINHPSINRSLLAAGQYPSRFLCVGFALALLASGCAGPRALKGGKAVTTRQPAGAIEQTLLQGENPSQASKQSQETVKVRTYTVPAGSRIELSQLPSSEAPTSSGQTRPSTINPLPRHSEATAGQPSTTLTLSAPMPIVERTEGRAQSELGAAQHDSTRELGTKLASLRGVVWVGVGLFLFGLASLVWPPLKVVIASVTTSLAFMAGGAAMMVLPSLVVGNELLILAVVSVALGSWLVSYRHGHARGVTRAGSANSAPTSADTRSGLTPHP